MGNKHHGRRGQTKEVSNSGHNCTQKQSVIFQLSTDDFIKSELHSQQMKLSIQELTSFNLTIVYSINGKWLPIL